MAEVTRFNPALVALHWLLALLIITALLFGFFGLAPMPNTDPQKIDILRVHMIVGITILALMAIRFGIRLGSARPAAASTGNGLLDRLQPVSHYGLYLLVLLMVASGIGTAFKAGLPAIVFGHSGAPLPETFETFTPFKVHFIVGSLLALLVTVHILAAFYHEFVMDDRLFRRMTFGRRDT